MHGVGEMNVNNITSRCRQKMMLYCRIFIVGTAEIIYHVGDANCGQEIIGFVAVCGCWHVELSCITERVKWLIWCLVRKGISGV
jgi:hypothetical protein